MPLTLGRFRIALEALAVFALCVSIGTCAITSREPDATAAQLSTNAHKASLLSLARRRTTDSLSLAVNTLQANATRRVTTVRRMSHEAEAILAANDTLLSYAGGASLDDRIAALSTRLAETTASYRTFLDSTNVLLASVDSLIATQLRERQAFHDERLAHAAQLAAVSAERDHYRTKAECTIGPLPCPTRKRSALAGFLAGVLTVAVVAR